MAILNHGDLVFNVEEENEFFEKCNPIKNPLVEDCSYEGTLFETYGKELEMVKSYPNNKIWTLLEGDSGEDYYISNGFQLVNRLGYFITEKPWDE